MTSQADVDRKLKEALRARDEAALRTLRLVKAELRKAELNQSGPLEDAAVHQALRKMAAQRREAIALYHQGGRDDLAAREAAELQIIEGFLPATISEETLDALIEETLARMGPVDPNRAGAAIGQVIAAVKATGLGFDGRAVQERVRQRLSRPQ